MALILPLKAWDERLAVALHPRLTQALALVRETRDEPFACGRHELEDDLALIVQDSMTEVPDRRRFEAHDRHADLQVVRRGLETMDLAARADLNPDEDLLTERDLIFFATPLRWSTLLVPADTAVWFAPQDAHRPGCTAAGLPDAPVRKWVFKLRLDRNG